MKDANGNDIPDPRTWAQRHPNWAKGLKITGVGLVFGFIAGVAGAAGGEVYTMRRQARQTPATARR